MIEAFARVLAAQLRGCASAASPYVVAIDGPACSGKSTLAERLLAQLPAVCLPTDDFHVPRGADPSPDGPAPYRRWSEVRAAVADLACGRAARYRPIDWSDRTFAPRRELAPAPIVIVEGIYSLHPDLRPRAHFAVWIDGSVEDRMARAAARVGEHAAQRWPAYLAHEQAYLARWRPWRSADAFVFGAGIEPARSTDAFSRRVEAGIGEWYR